ncbi:unnamed protein product [Alopecurus aequalis]
MEAAVGAAGWLLGKLLSKLSNDLVAAFVASTELGRNFESITPLLQFTQGLLHEAQGRDMITNPNPGLKAMLARLSTKADEAEDMLDEIHYFLIQDMLDGTIDATLQEPVAPQMGDILRSHVRDARHAARHTCGNWLPCFSCSRTQHDDPHSVDAAVVPGSSSPQNATKSASGNHGAGSVDKLSFDRVDMSNRIKSVIEEMSSICGPVSELLKIANQSSTPANTAVTRRRPHTGSTVVQDKLFGRSAIFEKTINALTGGTCHTETLSVLPIVGPGGIGKTTFTQHLYNDKMIEGHFTVKVWLCVSTDFDVLKLTRQIHSYLPSTEKEEYNCTNETATLDQLQKSISEKLKSKRFLIVLDDIWKCNSEADWKNLLSPLTKGEPKGSMILVTTRFPSIAHIVQTTDPVELRGLDADDFLEFFEACIFGHSKPAGHYANDLIDLAKDIATKLKGSPLAANTVGRLLSKNLSREYWMGVLEKDEWQNIKNDDDIMPSLKISYDYLPFHLKKCFSYCSLFPEDRSFYNFEMIGFWKAMGIVDSSSQNDRNYLEDLVDNGFLIKKNDESGQYYVMHDLLHELSKNISSQECVNISSFSFSADSIPESIRHLSITIENVYDENFEEEMGKLKSRIDIGNLRTLMIFGLDNVRIANILKNTFEKIKALRVLFIAMQTQKSLPNNFSTLIHLQYLKISSPYGLDMTLPITLSKLYHLKFLDLKDWCGSEKIPKYFSRLVNLCHFHSSKELHSNIPEVGNMKCLEELKEFYVHKENVGFELKELGSLRELAGELSVCNLETVRSKGEAGDAKLKNKRNLKELRLVWGTEHQIVDDDVLEGLHPPHNLRVLSIINPGVANGPSWLYSDVSTKKLESLHLEGVSWGTLPPFEQLPHLTELFLKNIAGMSVFGPEFYGVTERSFMHLKKIVFEDMPKLVEWVGGPISHIFSTLESIECRHCPFLCSFPFLEYSDLFINLCRLDIDNCPKLAQYPLLPHTSTLTYVCVKNDGSELFYDGMKLSIEGYTRALAFHNMDKLEVLKITGVSHITLPDLQMLNSLRSIRFKNCDAMFSIELDNTLVVHSVQNLHFKELSISGELLSKVLRCFPALSELTIKKCENLKLVPVENGGLLDLTMLQSFTGHKCGKLFSRWPMGAEVGGGARAIKPFPTCLRELEIFLEPSMQSMGLLSNLTSLTRLHLTCCDELTMDGFNPLITVNLKKLSIYPMPNNQMKSIAGDLLSEIRRSGLLHAGSFQLEYFRVNSIPAVLTTPICSHLAASLHTLMFSCDQHVTAFTEEQEQALQLLTSLQFLYFDYCRNLRSLPQSLRGLSSLKILAISLCANIQSLPPKEDLPTSLKVLDVTFCGPELSEQAKRVKGADPWFYVEIHE